MHVHGEEVGRTKEEDAISMLLARRGLIQLDQPIHVHS